MGRTVVAARLGGACTYLAHMVANRCPEMYWGSKGCTVAPTLVVVHVAPTTTLGNDTAFWKALPGGPPPKGLLVPQWQG